MGRTTDQSDLVFGLQWATSSPQDATNVNCSMEVCTGANLALISRGFDYWAYQNLAFVTVSAGNQGAGSQYVCSPANAYNVLGVGGFNNNNTADWADDTMYSSSSWRNPASLHSDREKPEVVAVGQNLNVWGWNNSLQTGQQGTSLASPQVAGLGALLIKKNSSLDIWPEASRAIIMASAIHNIEGSPGISRTVDAKDGAGAIVADQAVAIASQRGTSSSPCYVSCWWGEYMSELGNNIRREFFAQAGQRVRVALAWWAIADASPYTNDILDTDLDLWIRSPTNQLLAASISNDNNYELVDFNATEMGLYTLIVVNGGRPDNAPPNYFGIAVATTRYSVYLPAILR